MNDPHASDHDHAWKIALRDREEEAYSRLFDVFYADLVRFAMCYVRTLEVAEEKVLDVFSEIWRLGPDWNPRGSLRPYLYAAVKNRCIDHARKKQLDFDLSAVLDEIVASGGAEDELQYKELHAAIERAVLALPERRRMVFTLSRFQGLTYAEIAAVMGVSIKAVEKHMLQALKTLRERLHPFLSLLLLSSGIAAFLFKFLV